MKTNTLTPELLYKMDAYKKVKAQDQRKDGQSGKGCDMVPRGFGPWLSLQRGVSQIITTQSTIG